MAAAAATAPVIITNETNEPSPMYGKLLFAAWDDTKIALTDIGPMLVCSLARSFTLELKRLMQMCSLSPRVSASCTRLSSFLFLHHCLNRILITEHLLNERRIEAIQIDVFQQPTEISMSVLLLLL